MIGIINFRKGLLQIIFMLDHDYTSRFISDFENCFIVFLWRELLQDVITIAISSNIDFLIYFAVIKRVPNREYIKDSCIIRKINVIECIKERTI